MSESRGRELRSYIVHYNLCWAKVRYTPVDSFSARPACGADIRLVTAAAMSIWPEEISCPNCLASPRVQEIFIEVEIGYDGKVLDWVLDVYNRPNDGGV